MNRNCSIDCHLLSLRSVLFVTMIVSFWNYFSSLFYFLYSVNSFDIWGTYVFGEKMIKINKRIESLTQQYLHWYVHRVTTNIFFWTRQRNSVLKNKDERLSFKIGKIYMTSLRFTNQPWNRLSTIINKLVRICPLSSTYFLFT